MGSIVVKTGGLRFVCDDKYELWRAKTLFTKEQGTVDWIRREVKPGEVFCDVGASTGIYSLLAAQLVGDQGAVYAFEPHMISATHLLRNISANDVGHRIEIVCSALHESDGFFQFNYNKLSPGSPGSQLGHNVGENGKEFAPAAVELKHGTTMDRLVQDKFIRPPTHIKIDVDGNEIKVIRGMEWILQNIPPTSVQIEIHPRTNDEILAFMAEFRFNEVARHYTSLGADAIEKGHDVKKVFSNVIFKRV